MKRARVVIFIIHEDVHILITNYERDDKDSLSLIIIS